MLEVNAGGVGSLRVVGLAGDRIQIKDGHLIRNGVAIPEPYCDSYSGSDGDFPLPSNAYADDSLRSIHQLSFGGGMNTGQIYIVPEGFYFMLNDNRKQLTDSRTMGPIPREHVVARLMAAYSHLPVGLALPRVIH